MHGVVRQPQRAKLLLTGLQLPVFERRRRLAGEGRVSGEEGGGGAADFVQEPASSV
jgi:hypothetical protein